MKRRSVLGTHMGTIHSDDALEHKIELEALFKAITPEVIEDGPPIEPPDLDDWAKQVAAHALNNVGFNAWFADEPDDLYLTVFINEDEISEIGRVSLTDLVATAIKEHNQIGDEDEIAVLERLKTRLEEAIAERRKRLSGV